MANEQNLIPNSQRSPSEVRENSRKGGIKSGEVRREKRDRQKRMQQTIDMIVKDPETLERLKKAGVDAENITYEEAADAMQVLKAAREADTGAYRAVKEEAYGKLDAKTQLEVSGEIKKVVVEIKDFSKKGAKDGINTTKNSEAGKDNGQ